MSSRSVLASPRTGTTIENAPCRLLRVVNGPGSEIESEHPLASAVLQTRRGLNGVPAAISSSLAVSDGLGRLVQVVPQQAGGAAADYRYDACSHDNRMRPRVPSKR